MRLTKILNGSWSKIMLLTPRQKNVLHDFTWVPCLSKKLRSSMNRNLKWLVPARNPCLAFAGIAPSCPRSAEANEYIKGLFGHKSQKMMDAMETAP